MSAGFIKHGLKSHSSKSLYNIWKTKYYYFVSGSATATKASGKYHQFQHSKPYSRFTHKAKELELPAPTVVSSTLSSSTTSSRFGFVTWYLGILNSRPIITKSITSALTYTAADLSSQTIARESLEPYDLVRTLRMGGYGMIILGPSLHFWFNFVSRVLPKRDLITTVKKIVFGQAVYGPIMTAVFFSVNAALQGESGQEIVARLKRDLVPTMISGVMYWPFCDFLTFKFIPVHLQPLVSNGFAFLWNIYLTYMASREKVGTA